MSATATVDAAPPQHILALERANRIRLARAEIKRRIAEGRCNIVEVLSAPPRELETMAIGDLLMSQRRWGRSRCRRFLLEVSLSEEKEIGSLTHRQRVAVVRGLQGQHVRDPFAEQRVLVGALR
jgi:hypothetical protein